MMSTVRFLSPRSLRIGLTALRARPSSLISVIINLETAKCHMSVSVFSTAGGKSELKRQDSSWLKNTEHSKQTFVTFQGRIVKLEFWNVNCPFSNFCVTRVWKSNEVGLWYLDPLLVIIVGLPVIRCYFLTTIKNSKFFIIPVGNNNKITIRDIIMVVAEQIIFPSFNQWKVSTVGTSNNSWEIWKGVKEKVKAWGFLLVFSIFS